MVSWQQVLDDAPEFAATVQARFEIRKHATMATLRKDGSPRISGTEVEFEDGQLRLGSMPGALKARDLRRDPRIALHSPTDDPPEATPSDWSVSEVVFTRVAPSGEHLVIQMWHPGRGLEEVQRR